MLVIAAIDSSPTSTQVLAAATLLGPLLGAAVEAVHVIETPDDAVADAARAAGVPLRVLAGPVVEAIVGELDRPEVVLGVVGARRHLAGHRPAGHVALAVAPATDTPLVVVPPVWRPGPLERIVVPCEAVPSSPELVAMIEQLTGGGAELVALHVVDATSAPPFWEGPGYHADLWRKEFLDRWGPGQPATLELSVGSPGFHVLDATKAGDLLVLTWQHDLSPGRAGVVRRVLAESTVPVLLVGSRVAQALSA